MSRKFPFQYFDFEQPIVDPATGRLTPYAQRQLFGQVSNSEEVSDEVETFDGRITQNANDIDTLENRVLTAGTGLSGGGDLTADRTFDLDADIDLLTDVDTSTTPPTDGQALVWVAANSLWEPGTVSGGGGGGSAEIASASVTSAANAEATWTAADGGKGVRVLVSARNLSADNNDVSIELRIGGSWRTANYEYTLNLDSTTGFESETFSATSSKAGFLTGTGSTWGVDNTDSDNNLVAEILIPFPNGNKNKSIIFNSMYRAATSSGTHVNGVGAGVYTGTGSTGVLDGIRIVVGSGTFDCDVTVLAEESGSSGGSFSGARVYSTSDFSQGSGSNDVTAFDVEDFDVGSWYDTANPGYFTIPSGVEYVIASLLITDAAGISGQLIPIIELQDSSGTSIGIIGQSEVESAGGDTCTVTTGPVKVTAGQRIAARTFLSNSRTLDGGKYGCSFSILKLG